MTDEILPFDYIPLERAKLIRFAVDCDNASHGNFTSLAIKLDLPPNPAKIRVTTPFEELIDRNRISLFITENTGTKRAVLGPSDLDIPPDVIWPVDPRVSLNEFLRELRSGLTRSCAVEFGEVEQKKTDPEFWGSMDGEHVLFHEKFHVNKMNTYCGSSFSVNRFDISEYINIGGSNSFRARQLARRLDSEFSNPPDDECAHRVSPYLEFMLKHASALRLHDGRWEKKEFVERHLRENWDHRLGAPSEERISYMATFLRWPEHQKGGRVRTSRATAEATKEAAK